MFQFHTGSIRSRDFVVQIQREVGFNSTLVRLEDNTDEWFGKQIVCFNSTLVRLEVRVILQFILCCESFNSTLVRLEAAYIKEQHVE